MATATYTVSSLKDYIKTEMNDIEGLTDFSDTDMTNAYDEAARSCNFEVPLSTDSYKDIKNTSLINRMMRFLFRKAAMRHVLKFDVKDMKAGQIIRNLWSKDGIITKLDEEFEEIKNGAYAYLFVTDASRVFATDSVMPSGFKYDNYGMDTTKYKESVVAGTSLTVSELAALPTYTQATEPDIPNNSQAVWNNTTNNKTYLITDVGGTQYKVEVA